MNLNLRKFIKSGIALYIIQFMNLISPLLVLPYLTRTLSVEGFGQLSIFISICGLCYVLNDFGFNLSATYRIAKNHTDKINISRIIGSIYKLKLILFVITILSVYVYICNSDTFKNNGIILFFSLVLFCQSYQPIWLFQGVEKMKNITISFILSRVSYIALVLAFVKDNNDLTLVFAFYGVSQLVGMLTSNYLLYKEGYKISHTSFSEVLSELKYSFEFFLSRASVSIYTTASALIIGSISGQQQAALYSASEKLYQAMQSFTGPVSQALYPILTKQSDHNFLMKVVFIISIPLIVIVGIVAFNSEEIMSLIFGSAYGESGHILSIFCIVVVVNYISSNFGYPAFSSLGCVNIVNKTVIIGSFIQCVSLIILYICGAFSALTLVKALLLTEFSIMMIRVILYFYKKRKVKS